MLERPHENCYWVVPGRFMAGEYPIAIREEDGIRKLSTIVAAGISHFVDLTQPRDPLDPYEQILHKVVEPSNPIPGYDRFAIADMGIPDTPSLMNSVLDHIDGVLGKNGVPYVHCWGGIGRTGTVVGCWLVRQGHSGESALDTIAGHWATVAKRHRYPQSPQTGEQRDYVLRWAEFDHTRCGT